MVESWKTGRKGQLMVERMSTHINKGEKGAETSDKCEQGLSGVKNIDKQLRRLERVLVRKNVFEKTCAEGFEKASVINNKAKSNLD